MIGVKFSASFEAKRSRIRRLPKVINEVVDAARLYDATGFIQTYQKGIREDTFRLQRLKPETIARKEARGFSKPETPLYARGDEHKDTLINVWRVVRIKNGWRIRSRRGWHWEKRLKLDHLHDIHEFGRTIVTSKAVIVIPPRPAWRLARERYLKRKLRLEPTAEVRKAIRDVMRTGRAASAGLYVKKAKSEAREYADRD